MINFGPIRNIEKVQAFLQQAPYGTKREAIIAVTEYIIGDGSHGLSHDDPYRQTTRQAVYGRPFESDAQRRYVMAAIARGEIIIGKRNPDPTTQSSTYKYKMTNNGYGATIYNTSEGAYWARAWGGWKNWRNFEQVVAANIKGALRHATARINAALRRRIR